MLWLAVGGLLALIPTSTTHCSIRSLSWHTHGNTSAIFDTFLRTYYQQQPVVLRGVFEPNSFTWTEFKHSLPPDLPLLEVQSLGIARTGTLHLVGWHYNPGIHHDQTIGPRVVTVAHSKLFQRGCGTRPGWSSSTLAIVMLNSS
jgi:hypothetical protein